MTIIQGKSINPRLYLIIIITISVLLRIGTVLLIGNDITNLPGIADQISYNSLSVRLIQGYGFTFDQIWWPFTKANQPTAHWSYLYTFYLAGIYSLFGVNPIIPRLFQAVGGGIFLPLFIYRISKSVFQPRSSSSSQLNQNEIKTSVDKVEIISLTAAIWVSVYGYFIYYASALITETFYIIGILWCFDCALRIRNNANQKMRSGDQLKLTLWIELGISIGFTVLLRQVFLLFLPLLYLWFVWVFFRHKNLKGLINNSWVKNILFGIALSLIIITGIVLPFTVFNYKQFDRFVLLNTNAGYAFFWANHPIHDDKFIPIFSPEMETYQQLIPAELIDLNEAALDQELLKLGAGFIVQDPVRYIKLSISRIPSYFLFWPKTSSSLPSNITRVLSFGIALPFIISGIYFWGKKIKEGQLYSSPGLLLLLFIVCYSVIHLLSWVLIRYRLPVDAVGLIFAAFGIISIFQVIFRNSTDMHGDLI